MYKWLVYKKLSVQLNGCEHNPNNSLKHEIQYNHYFILKSFFFIRFSSMAI